MLGSMTQYRSLLRRYYYSPVHNLPSTSPLPHIGHAIAGIGGGWTVSFVAAPVEHIKARLQVQYHDARKHGAHSHPTSTPTTTPVAGNQPFYPGPIAAIKQIGASHGIRGLYHGLSSTLLFRSHFAVFWFMHSHLTDQFKKHTSLSDPAITFWAAGLGSQCFWITSYPFDVVKQRVMTDRIVGAPAARGEVGLLGKLWTGKNGYGGGEKYGKSWVRAVRGVYQEGGAGWRGFWRGFAPCILRAFPVNASALVVFEGMMRALP